MINANMRLYDFFTLGTVNEYGQSTISEAAQGKIKMAISIASQSTQDNILYKGCQYVGVTHDTEVNDTYIIQYGEERLKVLYTSQTAQNRPRTVFLARMG